MEIWDRGYTCTANPFTVTQSTQVPNFTVSNVTLARQTQGPGTANPRSHLHLTQLMNDVPKISLSQQTQGYASGANPRWMSKNGICTENATCLLQILPRCFPAQYTWTYFCGNRCIYTVHVFRPKIALIGAHSFFQKRPNSIFEMKPCDPASLIETPPEPSLILEGL